jgi:hypothetical protein
MDDFEAYGKVLDSKLSDMRKENERKISLFEKMMKQKTLAPHLFQLWRC